MSWPRRVVSLLLLAAVAAAVIVVVVITSGSGSSVMQTTASESLRVRGDKLVFGPGAGTVVQLRGVNRSGAEYQCIQPKGGFFDSPTPDLADSNAIVTEMTDWNINVVRLPLNEGCWLGINSPSEYGGAAYRTAIMSEVKRLNDHHLFVILTLQWNSSGAHYASSPLPMADAQHAPAFWKSVARTFKGDGWLMFDLFNEPHNITWRCWLKGCYVKPSKDNSYGFEAAGMQQLIDAVRSTGNAQPIILSGNSYALDLTGYYDNTPTDPDHSLVLGVHTYGGRSPCNAACETTNTDAAKHLPVLYGELGEFDCADDYLKRTLPILDRHGIGYLAWAWDATSAGANGWSCSNGPALIKNYGGTPTAYGAGYRAHLIALGEPLRP